MKDVWWELFWETGDIEAYLKYKDGQGENQGATDKNDGAGCESNPSGGLQ